jgi:Uma2 family endonuclease
MALAYVEYYTFEDYKKWEGDWELIDGIAYAISPFALPSHQRVAVKIVRQLDENLEECKKCFALMESEVKFSETTILRPDVLMKCGELDDISVIPEIIFEVVSKGSEKRDEILKFSIYKQEGVKYYVIVYPDLKKVKVYKLINGEYKLQNIKDKLKIDDLTCKIDIDFNKVWL